MVDYDKIGKRIQEERKHILKLSQERMAEELGMYQADISNLEKAKNGSGITDLSKLDMIAEYLGMPLETLIFGQEGKNMPVYYGNTMTLKKEKKKIKKAHAEILLRLMGAPKEASISDIGHPTMYSCGPYTIYCPLKTMIGYHRESKTNYAILQQQYVYVFFGNEVAAIMVADITGIMQHIFMPALKELQETIPATVLDVTDPLRTINPYWALAYFAENEEEEQVYEDLMFKRMDEIRSVAQEDKILYVENIYVREDFRRKGICRMLLDLLKKEYGEHIIWLNMEPTAGAELDREYGYMPSYTASELGQLHINAAIAEHLGLTVDPDTWHIQADTVDDDGNITTKVLEVRKCAYKIPKKIRDVIKNDGNLVALGRAKQKIKQSNDEGHSEMDIRDGHVDGYFVYEQKIRQVGGKDNGKIIYCFGAISEESGRTQYGISTRSPLDHGVDHEGIIEKYYDLESAAVSEYYNELKTAESFIGMRNHQSEIAQMDMYDEDCQYQIGMDEAGNLFVLISVMPTKGKWVSKTIYGAAFYDISEESVNFEISEKSYEDVVNEIISESEYDDSILEHYLSEDGSLPLPENTEFFLMYDLMQQLIVQQIMENCHN